MAPDSTTETFVALKLKVESWRWAGVPIFIRTGKEMPMTATEIVVRLKNPPGVVYPSRKRPPGHDDIVLRIGKNSGVGFSLRIKKPGPTSTSRRWSTWTSPSSSATSPLPTSGC